MSESQEKVLRREASTFRIVTIWDSETLFAAGDIESGSCVPFDLDEVSANNRDLVRAGATFQRVISTVRRRDGRIEHRSEIVFDRKEEPPKEEA